MALPRLGSGPLPLVRRRPRRRGAPPIGLETLLSTRQPLLKLPHPAASTSCAFRGFVLKLRSGPGITVSNLLQLLSTEFFSLRSVCNICTTKIHTQTVGRLFRFGWLRFDLNVDVIGAIFALHQRCRSWLLSLKQVPLVVANRHHDVLAASNKRDAHSPLLLDQDKNSCIVLDACGRKDFDKSAFQLGGLAVGANPTECLLGEVCRKAKQGTGFVVKAGLHTQSITALGWNLLIDPGASICERLECCINLLGLFSRGG